MYEAPAENLGLYAQFDVSYVVISSWERSNYQIDEDWFTENFELVFMYEDIDLYRLK